MTHWRLRLIILFFSFFLFASFIFRVGISPVSVTHGRPLAKYFFFFFPGRKNAGRRESISQSWALLFSPSIVSSFLFSRSLSSSWGDSCLNLGYSIDRRLFLSSPHTQKKGKKKCLALFLFSPILACMYLYIHIYKRTRTSITSTEIFYELDHRNSRRSKCITTLRSRSDKH